MDISFEINLLLRKRGLTQKALAEKIGFSVPAFSRALQKGDFKISVLQKIANALDVSLSYFFCEEKEKDSEQLINIFKRIANNEKIYFDAIFEMVNYVDEEEKLKTILFDIKSGIGQPNSIISKYSNLDTKDIYFLLEKGFINKKMYLLIMKLNEIHREDINKMKDIEW